MGDAPIAYVEGAGGTRVAEEQIVAVGKNDVCASMVFQPLFGLANLFADPFLQGRTVGPVIPNQHECSSDASRMHFGDTCHAA